MFDSIFISNSHNILCLRLKISVGIPEREVLQSGKGIIAIPYKMNGFIFDYL